MNKDTLKQLANDLGLAAHIAAFTLALVSGSVMLFASTTVAFAASLKSNSTITGEYIKLGDIFDGVENADYVLGPAPAPGKDMILNAKTLYRIASSLDVEWSPSSSSDQLILHRDASVIPQSEVTSRIEDKLKKEGVDGKFTVTYATQVGDLVLPGGTDASMEITAFSFDPQKDMFNAVIVAPSADNPLKRMNVSGRIERMVAVPVLMNTLRNGDIISARDIDFIDIPESKVANGTVLDQKDIVNMTPKRTVFGGKPMISNELEQPKMVDRGDDITLVFENGSMVLTTKGKSLQAGAMGDTIRVANADSNKNLTGVVTGHREVTIR